MNVRNKTLDWQAQHKLGAPIAIFNLILVAFTSFVFTGLALADDNRAPLKIVAFGDSLTAGYQLAASAAFPAQLEKALRAKGHNVTVINAGVSGDTTAAGLARIDWAVPPDTSAVILELGANDFLRGIDPAIMRANLDKILSRLTQAGKPVLIAGMISPQNWGDSYEAAATPIYAELAKKYNAGLYPFFVDGIARNPKLNLADGLHPNPEGVKVIVTRMLPKVEELIARATANAAPKIPKP